MSDCSTHAFEMPLKSCPFCGGEAETCHVTQLWEPRNSYWVKCKNCRINGVHHTTEAEAIAAWNSRADYHGYEQAAIEAWESIKAWNTRAERTCRNDDGWCSECEHYLHNGFKWCPWCGAKVVDA